MVELIALGVSGVALAVSIWDWWSLRHVRRWVRDLREDGVYRS